LSRRWRQLGFQEVSTTVPIEVELPLDADAANELGAQISAARFSSGAPALEAELPVADELQLGCCCVRVNFREFRKAEVQLPRIDALRSTRTGAHGGDLLPKSWPSYYESPTRLAGQKEDFR
jgi:hypothetical protein